MYEEFVIFAVNTGKGREKELAYVNDFLKVFPDYPVVHVEAKRVQGCYKGAMENSYMVSCPIGGATYGRILELAERHNQESVLLVGDDKVAWLYFVEDQRHGQVLGNFTEASPSEAMDGDAWTRVNDRFFVIK